MPAPDTAAVDVIAAYIPSLAPQMQTRQRRQQTPGKCGPVETAQKLARIQMVFLAAHAPAITAVTQQPIKRAVHQRRRHRTLQGFSPKPVVVVTMQQTARGQHAGGDGSGGHDGSNGSADTNMEVGAAIAEVLNSTSPTLSISVSLLL